MRKTVATLSLSLALLSLPIGVVAGAGVFVALLALIVASVGLVMGAVRSAFVVLGLASVSIFGVSPLTSSGNIPRSMILVLLIPFGTFLLAALWHLHRRRRSQGR